MCDQYTPSLPVQVKKCAKCGETKSVAEFHRSKASRDGYTPNCKTCRCRRRDPEGHNRKLADRGGDRVNGLKRCPKCGEVKPIEAFYHNRTTTDGLERLCKRCKSSASDKDAHEQRLANRAAGIKRCGCCGEVKPLAQFGKAAGRPDGHNVRCKACAKATSAAYYAANRDKHMARCLSWNRANREKMHAIYRKWRIAHVEASRESGRRRRARERGARIFPITEAALLAKIEYWGGRCWICGADADTLDHVKPLAKGGLHVLANIRPCCGSCNASKKDRWPFPLVRNTPHW